MLLFALFSLSVICFACSSFDDGEAAWQKSDYAKAYKNFKAVAEQGDTRAQNTLGLMYANGQGVAQDFVQAHKWFNVAAAQGDLNALKARDKVAEKMTSPQISEAQRLTREWKPGGKD